MHEIITINLPFLFNLGTVNCYLVKTDTGFILIDTGWTNQRSNLEKELEIAGCKPGNLELIILTHGDFDHAGNCAFLRKKFGAKIAMHADDSGMIERGDMFWNREAGNFFIKLVAKFLFRLKKSDRFKPDLFFEDGYDLSEFGFDARIIHIPGHSRGSLGILTSGGELFCGDLFENTKKPNLNSIIDDMKTANASVERLKSLKIKTVHPGHGKPFQMEQLITKEVK